MFASGIADLDQPHLLLSMHFSKKTPMALIRIKPATNLQDPCLRVLHSFSAALRRQQKRYRSNSESLTVSLQVTN